MNLLYATISVTIFRLKVITTSKFYLTYFYQGKNHSPTGCLPKIPWVFRARKNISTAASLEHNPGNFLVRVCSSSADSWRLLAKTIRNLQKNNWLSC